ncbi:MAG: histidine--tRNA ligase [Alphaproteobacteria bacterium]
MNDKSFRPKARIPRGFRDRGPDEIAAERRMLDTVRAVYESYGFEALETPSFEYADALGKFLPEQDRPNEGVFSLEDDDGQWLALRYDLTAPLARYVAENFQNLPKPFRRYQVGTLWRNEKPGPGRYREFVQFDADTVGSSSPAADAELLMMVCDALEALGLKQGEYAVKLNSRRVLDGVLESAHIDSSRRGAVLRAIDKMDRFGLEGVRALLGKGRKDDSGDFTRGAELSPGQVDSVLAFISNAAAGDGDARIEKAVGDSAAGREGVQTLRAIEALVRKCGYGPDRIRIDTSVVRGLDYYTGAVFEAAPQFRVTNELGEQVIIGSLAGGGRYDDLVARFTGQQVPATGISIGVSRFLTALCLRGLASSECTPLVFVLVLEKADAAASFALARELREAGLRAETYTGDGGMKAQLKYADKRGAAIAVIEGGDERAKREVTLKDLALGAELAKSVESRAVWVKDRPAQISVKRNQLVPELRKLLAR